MSGHTPGPWIMIFEGRGNGFPITGMRAGAPRLVARVYTHPDDALLVSTAPALLALAHQYAEECGECAGTRIRPDDTLCPECVHVWAVIDAAEGRA